MPHLGYQIILFLCLKKIKCWLKWIGFGANIIQSPVEDFTKL